MAALVTTATNQPPRHVDAKYFGVRPIRSLSFSEVEVRFMAVILPCLAACAIFYSE